MNTEEIQEINLIKKLEEAKKLLDKIDYQTKMDITWDDCPECGNGYYCVIDDHKHYEVHYSCEICGFNDTDDYIDLYGCMSVPYGFV